MSSHDFEPTTDDRSTAEDNQLSQYVKDPIQFDYQLQLPIGPPGARSLSEEQTQTDEGQTAIDQNVSVYVPQDDEDGYQIQSTDSVLNLKLPISPTNAHSLSGSSTNLVHCNRLEPPRDKKLHVIVIDDDDDDDDVILDPNHEHSVEKFSTSESGMVCVQGYTVITKFCNNS
ncbi:uncharacterized protein LOC143602319 [Bidens hawaiensis]|uniref:uncharacterized protein LOC143602319 n=1 Tax=Bidens hawaiensis TaxID=980011 RepID=UPI00404A5148